MADEVELRIVLKGTDGVEDGATLSLRLFGKALVALSKAAQSVAGGIVSKRHPSSGRGRLPDAARNFDVRLVSFRQGSTDICCALRDSGPTAHLPYKDDLPELVSVQLVHCIEQESRGERTNAAVRKFVEALPQGVSSHHYEVRKGGELLMETTIERTKAKDEHAPKPRLRSLEGRVASVGFEDGHSFVAIRVGTRTVRATATRDLVDSAVALRSSPVVSALLLDAGPSTRWIRISPAPFEPPSPEERLKRILKDDAEILKRLAQ